MAHSKAKTKKLVTLIKSFFKEDDVKFSVISDECLEVYIQASNVNLIILIYVSNGHVVVRAPEFIRNIDLQRMEVVQFLMKVMSDVLDIRFEISDDGKALSSSCQHIVEDGTLTKSQFDFMMMIVIRISDDIYPKLMQIVYTGNNNNNNDSDSDIDLQLSDKDLMNDNLFEEFDDDIEDELDAYDEHANSDDDDHKIN